MSLFTREWIAEGGKMKKLTKQPGKLLLALWLILMGLVQLAHLSFAGIETVMGIVAIAAAIFIALKE